MSLQDSLSAVEQLIEKVSAAILAADPQALEKNSIALRDAAAHFSRLLEQSSVPGKPLPPAVQKRVNAISSTLALHRDSLARLSANADRQVAGLLPQADSAASSTYGDGRQPKAGVARIYRSAG